MGQTLAERQEETNRCIITVDFNTPLSVSDRIRRQEISKDTDLNHSINHDRKLQQNQGMHSSVHRTLTKTIFWTMKQVSMK